MLPTDKKTPGTYYLAEVFGTPERIGSVSLVVLHGDGHLEIVRSKDTKEHLHTDATDSLWPRLAWSPQTARATAARIFNL